VEGEDPRLYAFEIANEAGQVLLELPFTEVLGPTNGGTAISAMKGLAAAKERAQRIQGLASSITREVLAARQILKESRSVLSRAQRWDSSSEG